MREPPSEEEQELIRSEVHRLQIEHRDLDAAIAALEQLGSMDQLQVQRLKKRKLQLKDRLIALHDRLTPDIIA
ncbi:MAG: YdcH family protein [Rhabdaerophilum sp.]